MFFCYYYSVFVANLIQGGAQKDIWKDPKHETDDRVDYLISLSLRFRKNSHS